jgi:hypothetical protein
MIFVIIFKNMADSLILTKNKLKTIKIKLRNINTKKNK